MRESIRRKFFMEWLRLMSISGIVPVCVSVVGMLVHYQYLSRCTPFQWAFVWGAFSGWAMVNAAIAWRSSYGKA